MKYDEQIFNLSMEAYNMSEPTKAISTEEKKKQDHLLKILLKKFEEKLKSKESVGNGILTIRIRSPFFCKSDEGYEEIRALGFDGFNSFASEYCMYLGDIEYRSDEWYTAYYEIIWDYKTYFEQVRETKMGIDSIKSVNNSKINAKRKMCKANGHEWGPWKEIIGTKTVSSGPTDITDRGFYKETSNQVQIPKWQRKCMNCGCVSTVENKPPEVEIDELKEQIQKLQRKIPNKKITMHRRDL